jgi:drug/metabolite transporter (DMT)-like permease
MARIRIGKTKPNRQNGWLNGFIGVVLFSGTLPATRIAVLEFNPVFVTVARASIAGILALAALLVCKEKRPTGKQLLQLTIVAIGVVVGFPLSSALALRYITSAHSIVFIGVLPLVTTFFGLIRGGERPRPIFWLFALLGSLLVVGYAVVRGVTASPIGDILMLVAIILCGLGYAEGAKLSKSLGGWQVISWALTISLPLMLCLVFFNFPSSLESISVRAWVSIAYVSIFSMFVAFIFWYRGLAQGGIATVGQLQLLQPFFGLALAALFLGEELTIEMLAVTIAVILCVAATKKF